MAKGNFFTTSERGISMQLTEKDIARILDIPLKGWDHYMKFDLPSLDNMASNLAITRKFYRNTALVQHRYVLKWEMTSLYQLYFDIDHKMIIP